MPSRPAKVNGINDLLHVLNQSVVEMNQRIDLLQKVAPVHKALKTSATLNFGAISANSTVERNAFLAGVSQTATIHASPQLALGNANLIWSAYVAKNGVVTVRLLNPTGSPVTPNTVSWNVSAIQ